MKADDKYLAEALGLMEAALALLDKTDAHEVGAHLDLAVRRLQDLLSAANGPSPSSSGTR